MFDQVKIVLDRAKDNFRASLRSIDSELRKIVSQDPSQLAGARAIQASYGEDLEGAELAAAEQPAAAPAPKVKAKHARKAAPKTVAERSKAAAKSIREGGKTKK